MQTYIFVLMLILAVIAGAEMDYTAKRDQTVCLTRPWLDVKPPC